jgi:uncharacterized membrane protein YphA (DoxX/SURF4 family)
MAFAATTISTTRPVSRTEQLAPYALWAAQGVLALVFIFAGSMKFVMPIEDMQKDIAWPASFLYFIGFAEVLGGLGMILPSVFRVRALTPVAAAGLLVIMIGATVSTFVVMPAGAVMPFVIGALALFVMWGRREWLLKG